MSGKEKTLEQLENDYWGAAQAGSSKLVITCYDLRKKNIGGLGVEDLRLLIGQNIGLEYLIPIAVEIVKADPFIEGDFYEGDLLENLLKVKEEFWDYNPKLKEELKTVFEKNKEALMNHEELTEDIKADLLKAYDSFTES